MSLPRAPVLDCCLALHALSATAQEYDGFRAGEARAFHERILREGMSERGSGGTGERIDAAFARRTLQGALPGIDARSG